MCMGMGVCGCVCVCRCVHVCVYICVLSLFSLSIIVSPILCTTDNTTMCLYYQYCRSTIAFLADYFLFRADVTENPPADWSRPVRHCGLAAEMPLEAFNAARRPVAGTASAVAALCINGYIENTLKHSGRQTHAGRRTANRTLYNQALTRKIKPDSTACHMHGKIPRPLYSTTNCTRLSGIKQNNPCFNEHKVACTIPVFLKQYALSIESGAN